MAAEQGADRGPVETTLESRLDAIDQLLLGCVPRGERLAIVASLEERLRGTWNGSSGGFDSNSRLLDAGSGRAFAGTMPYPLPLHAPRADLLPGTWPNSGPSRLRRSKLALASGILGILGGVLVCGTPIAYGVVAFLAEILDETAAIIALVAYVALILFASAGAIGAGVVALWRLRRRQTEVGGRGWAITGLCTGPIPLGLTCLIALYVGIQVIGTTTFFSAEVTPSPPASSDPIAAVPPQPPALPVSATLPVDGYLPSGKAVPATCAPASCAAPTCAAPACAAPVSNAPLCASGMCAAPTCAAPTCAAPASAAPVRVASELSTGSPVPVELLVAPATVPPPSLENLPPAAIPAQPSEPTYQFVPSGKLVE